MMMNLVAGFRLVAAMQSEQKIKLAVNDDNKIRECEMTRLLKVYIDVFVKIRNWE